MTTTTAPSLPDSGALVAASSWVSAREGLLDATARWQRELPSVRRELAAEAASVARPRLWIDTVASFATTGWKITSAAAPDAPFALLGAAAAASGLAISPPRDSRGTLRRAERLVR